MLTAIRNLNYIRSKDARLYEAMNDVIAKARAAAEKVTMGGQELLTLPVDHPVAAGDLDAVQVSHTFAAANTAYTIPHNLGRIPVGYFVVVNGTGATAIIFNGNFSHWTDKTIELQSTAATTVRMIVF